MGNFFVRRPIVAMVIAIVIVIVGSVSLIGLPIEQYPNLTPPIVQVRATYTGANYLATVCAICKAQLPESMHYWDVPVKVGGVIDLLANALKM